ncbi:hypothetical protein EZS27_029069 [termite gut metagenome]|uniref:Uncharacterized protein n=1 Tax=termite gut metagenome TaxID=433724 RepID=A0A5J4QJQ0_9ZZZZ
MAQVKIESVKKKIEKEELAFLNNSSVSNEIKANYTGCDNSDEGLRKKYIYLAQWRAKQKKEQQVESKHTIDITEIRSMFRELRNVVDVSDKRIVDLINKEVENLAEYINTTEQRKKEYEKARLLKEKERIERLLAEL